MPSGNVFSQLRFVVGAVPARLLDSADLYGRRRLQRHRHRRQPVGRGDGVHAAVRLAHQRALVLVLHGHGRRLQSRRPHADRRREPRPGTTSATTRPTPGNSNCTTNPPTVAAASQTVVTQLTATTTTDIHNAAHPVVTVVPVGTTVHDFVTVSGGAGNPFRPATSRSTGSRTTPARAARRRRRAASRSPTARSTRRVRARARSLPGSTRFRGALPRRPGNPVYAPSDGPCEPLRVVDANIQITPDGDEPRRRRPTPSRRT